MVERDEGAGRAARGVLWVRLHPVTFALTLANVAWFVWAEAHGSTLAPDHLLAYGAVEPVHVGAGQFWRMGSYMFLHIGWIHLVWNAWAGASWCTAVERTLGHATFGVIYLVSGVAGGAASVLFSPAVSAGASGAMFGMVGATLAIRARQLGTWRDFARDRGVRATVANIALWTVLGIVAMPMNHYAHFGGLLFGGAASWVATAPRARLPLALALAVVLFGALGLAVARPLAFRRDSAAIDPRGRSWWGRRGSDSVLGANERSWSGEGSGV